VEETDLSLTKYFHRPVLNLINSREGKTMSNEMFIRNNHGRNRGREGNTIISRQSETLNHFSSQANNSDGHHEVFNVPSTIFIPSNAMTRPFKTRKINDERVDASEPRKPAAKQGKSSNVVAESSSISQMSEAGAENIPPDWAKGLFALISDLGTQIKELSDRLDHVQAQAQIDRQSSNPHTDPHFHKLHVQQYLEKGSTWSLMKLKHNNGDLCVGITSAHLLATLRNPKGQRLFLALPRAFYDVGVKNVLLHERILDDKENSNISSVDVMLVVLGGMPTIDGRISVMEQLEVYPDGSIEYNSAWGSMEVKGKSQRDFVTGQGVMKALKNDEVSYQFIATSGEEGDSGTLLYVTDELGNKTFVGIYKGSFHWTNKRSKGWITPVVGWRELEMLEVEKKVNNNTPLRVIYKGKEEKFDYELQDNGACKLLIDDGANTIYGTLVKVPENMISKFTCLPYFGPGGDGDDEDYD